MLAEALQAEVDAYIAQFADERDGEGRRLVVRNGYHQPRERERERERLAEEARHNAKQAARGWKLKVAAARKLEEILRHKTSPHDWGIGKMPRFGDGVARLGGDHRAPSQPSPFWEWTSEEENIPSTWSYPDTRHRVISVVGGSHLPWQPSARGWRSCTASSVRTGVIPREQVALKARCPCCPTPCSSFSSPWPWPRLW